MSWVIVNKSTGAAICEVWNKSTVDKVNTSKYTAIPALQYLQSLNTKIKKAVK
jgi:hypothetical protein